MGRGVLGFGVPTSLFLAIFVFALANSSRSVCGISGSKRMPFRNKEQVEDVFISLEVNRNGDKINIPVNPAYQKKKSARALILTAYTEYMKTCDTTCPQSQGDFVYSIKNSI